MKKVGLLTIILLVTLVGRSQYGVYGGLTTIKGFGIPKMYLGCNFGVEIPNRDEATFYLRVSFTIKNSEQGSLTAEAIDPITNPQIILVPTRFGTGHINIEGGNRYYLGRGFDDYGFSAYGGAVYTLYSMGVNRKSMTDFDESKYTFKDGASAVELPQRGRIIAFGIGMNGGLQYNFGTTVVFTDVTATYNIFAFASNSLASQYSLYSPINIAMNVGLRKTLF